MTLLTGTVVVVRWRTAALAQRPEVLVLDEPANHLDPAHQISALGLVASQGVTTIVALNAGTIAAAGPPAAVLTGDVFREVFAVGGSLIPDPVDGRPRVLLRGWNSTPAPGELATGSRPGR
jgi:iron complex transport system ATP-binding protein